MKKTIFTILVGLMVVLSSSISKPVTIYMIGDSTMSIKQKKAYPETGWGMALATFVKDNAIVKDCARNGRSSKSFIDEGLWKAVYNNITKGDYVIIQFGHNDEKTDPERHTDPQTSYKKNLIKYIKETREKGGHPVLCTSIVRHKFGADGKLINTHGDYPEAMREVAKKMNVPLVDLQKLTENKINKIGSKKSEKLYMILQPGKYKNFPNGKSDSTHLRVEGARFVARLFIKNASKQKLPISQYFKVDE